MEKERIKSNRKLIRELNRIQFAGLRGIKVGDVLSVPLTRSYEWTDDDVRQMELSAAKGYHIKKTCSDPECAFLYSHSYINRKDHLARFHAVENLFQDKLVITAQDAGAKKQKWNPYLLLIPVWLVQMRGLDCTDLVRRGLCYHLCQALGYAQEAFHVLKKHPSVKKVIFFFDVSAIDSILIQKCNQNGYITYTLEHGIVNGAYDYIDYKCSNARYLLLWGEYSKKTAEHYGVRKERIKVVGNINQLVNRNPGIHKERKTGQIKNFVVCTSAVIVQADWKKNKQLIEMANTIARDLHITYVLKVHPGDKATRYTRYTEPPCCAGIYDKRTKLAKLLETADFMLCGNSTTFGDAIFENIPAFRLITPEDRDVDVCKGIGFGRVTNVNELRELLKDLMQNPDAYMERLKEVKDFLYGKEDPEKQYYVAVMEKG